MAAEISRTIALAPLFVGLIVYWAVALAYFRWRVRRSVEPAVLRALPGGGYEIAVEVRLAPIAFTLLLPFAVLFIAAALRG